MAAWDNINLPSGPTPNSYAGRLVDFSNVGNLYGDYAKGQLLQNQLQQQNAFPQGLPKDAQGNLDYNSIAQTLAKIGGVPGALQALPLLQSKQWLDLYRNQGPPPTGEEEPQPQPRARQPISVPPTGIPVQQATEGMISAVPQSGPNAGRNIAPEVNAAGATGTPTRTVENAQTPAEDVRATPQAGTLQPGVSEKAAKNLDSAAAWYAQRAEISKHVPGAGPGAGAGDIALSKQFADRAAKMREQLAKGPEALQASQIKRSEAKYNGIDAAASQYENEGKPYTTLAGAIFNDPRAYSGIGASRALDFNRIKGIWGDQTAAALQEGMSKLTAQQTLSTINLQRDQVMEAGSNSARIFSQQVNLAMKAAAGLENTLTGNRFLTEVGIGNCQPGSTATRDSFSIRRNLPIQH
jgi:hypothetical protein